MPVIDGVDLTKNYGVRAVLDQCRVTLRRGERVGLVGNNGSGKSTLGRILGGVEEADSGNVAVRRDARIVHLAQEPVLPSGRSIRDVTLHSLEDWSEAKRRHDDATAQLEEGSGDTERLITEQAAAGEAIERLGGWDRLHEADTILSHLGLDDPDREVQLLSGGERRRVALAQVLINGPDLAILDEPTNHLDVPTIEWLEEFIVQRFRGGVLLITHDRAFLERVTTRTLELHDGKLESYDGGYSEYLIAKADRQAMAERTERNRQNFLRKEVEWLRRQPKARGTKQKARISRAQDALDQKAPQEERTAQIKAESQRQGKMILEFSHLTIEREGRVLVRDLDLALRAGQRIGVVGPNGTGKTSLLLAILEELEPSKGKIQRGQNTRIGYLDQSRSDLDDAESIRDAVAGDRPQIEIGGESMRVESYLERFLFDAKTVRVKVSELSGGERARVCLAKLLSQPSNLLLLDEPTNDLDVATLGALESMLVDFGGSVLIVSHDRWFLDRVATSLLVFEGDGDVDLHPGNYSDYRERTENARAASREPRAVTPSTAGSASPPTAKKGKKLGYKEQRELEGLFGKIEKAEEEIGRLEAELADPSTYERDRAEVTALQAKLEEAQNVVTSLNSRWEELETKKEALASESS